jgi:hypothetical protein
MLGEHLTDQVGAAVAPLLPGCRADDPAGADLPRTPCPRQGYFDSGGRVVDGDLYYDQV